MQNTSHSIFFPVSLLVIVIAGTICIGLDNVLASDQALPTTSKPDSIKLKLTGGKIYGQFVDQPLSEVLDKIGNQSNFKNLVSQNLLGHRVSGSFAGASLTITLQKILEPFNYIVVSGEKGVVRRVLVISLKSNVAEGITSTIYKQLTLFGLKSNDTESTNAYATEFSLEQDNVSNDVHEEFDLADQDRFLFAASKNKAPLPPAFRELPGSQSPESQETGPESPTTIIQDLPDFEPITNETGPIVPDLNTELPEFKPYYSENGPTLP